MHKITAFNEACSFIKKGTLAQVFSCEFCQISKNIFFTEHLWATASILREGRRLKQIEISIISKLTKKIIKKEKCSYIFYFLLVVLILFLFGLHFLQRGLMFHYIRTFIMFKHAEFGKHTWNIIWKKTSHWVWWKHNKSLTFSQLLKSEAWYVKNIKWLKARCIKWLHLTRKNIY